METMNGGSRNVATKKPVIAPQTHPSTNESSMAGMNPMVGSVIMNTHAVSAITEPMEISSCPQRSTNVNPTATIPYAEMLSKSPVILTGLKKYSLVKLMNRKITTASIGMR